MNEANAAATNCVARAHERDSANSERQPVDSGPLVRPLREQREAARAVDTRT